MNEQLISAWRNVTAAGRMNHDEAAKALQWLVDQDYVTLTGDAPERAPDRVKPYAYKPDGTPVWKR